ncbi:MAG: asparagine synthase-related protein [Candidatus Scalindua sp.]
MGGDELLGGYPSFRQIPKTVKALSVFGIAPFLGKGFRLVAAHVLKRFTFPKYAGLFEYGTSYSGAYLLRRGLFMPWELPEIMDGEMARDGWQVLQPLLRLEETIQGIGSDHLKVSALEMNWYMRNQLLRDSDWAGMAHSLEIRVPLVDVELLRTLIPLLGAINPPDKRDMACAAAKNLPEDVLNRNKTGFTVPVKEWLLADNGGMVGGRGLRVWARRIFANF